MLRAADRPASPWKNGHGLTRTVASAPSGPDGEPGWRVSIADIDQPGPFSRFEGISRILIVIAGRLRLQLSGDGEKTLDTGESLAFPGEQAVEGLPLGGPVRALNIMWRRHAWLGSVRPVRAGFIAKESGIAVALTPCPGFHMLDAAILDNGDALPEAFAGYVITLQPV